MFKTHSGNVAKERLKLMMNADHQKLDDATMELIRQEIGCEMCIRDRVYTMVITIFLYFIILKINQKLEAIEKRSASKFV